MSAESISARSLPGLVDSSQWEAPSSDDEQAERVPTDPLQAHVVAVAARSSSNELVAQSVAQNFEEFLLRGQGAAILRKVTEVMVMRHLQKDEKMAAFVDFTCWNAVDRNMPTDTILAQVVGMARNKISMKKAMLASGLFFAERSWLQSQICHVVAAVARGSFEASASYSCFESDGTALPIGLVARPRQRGSEGAP